jgi:hypothetical protein
MYDYDFDFDFDDFVDFDVPAYNTPVNYDIPSNFDVAQDGGMQFMPSVEENYAAMSGPDIHDEGASYTNQDPMAPSAGPGAATSPLTAKQQIEQMILEDMQQQRSDRTARMTQAKENELTWRDPRVQMAVLLGGSMYGSHRNQGKQKKAQDQRRAEQQARQEKIDNPGGTQFATLNRTSAVPTLEQLRNYGRGPTGSQFQYFADNRVQPKQAAQGGPLNAMRNLATGPGGGLDDRIPAMLSDGEYVFDAGTVADIGDGSTQAGARKLDAMRQNIRKHKRSAPAKKVEPRARRPEQYLSRAARR